MGCPTCPDNDMSPEASRSVNFRNAKQQDVSYLTCPSGHKMLAIKLTKTEKCVKNQYCPKPEKKFVDFCKSTCPERLDEYGVEVKCPMCGKVRVFFYCNQEFEIDTVNSESVVKAIKSLEWVGNILKIEPMIVDLDTKPESV